MNKTVSIKKFAIISLFLIIATSSLTYVIAQTFSSPDLWMDDFPATAKAVIKTDGYYSWAVNASGAVNYESTNITETWENVRENWLTSSRTWKETVIFRGDFTATSTIILKSYTKIIIDGLLKAANNLNASLIANNASIGIGAYNEPTFTDFDIEICGTTIDGNKYNQGAGFDTISTITLIGVNNFHVHDLTLLRGWTSGIRTTFSQNGRVAFNYVEDCGDDGIAINAQSSNITVIGNIIKDSGMGGKSYGSPNGLEIQDGASFISVKSNIISNINASGIESSIHTGQPAPYMCTVTGNVINNCNFGIMISGNSVDGTYPNGTIISQNIIGNITNDGITANYVGKIEIMTNTISICGGSGIILYYNPCQASIIGNSIFGCTTSGDYGIQIRSHGNFIAFNTVADNDIGIGVFGDENFIVNNFCYDTESTQRYGFGFYGGADNNFADDNICVDHTTAASFDAGTGNTITETIP